MNDILKLVKQFQGTLISQEFDEQHCLFVLDFRLSIFENVLNKIESLRVLGADLEILKDE